MNRTMYIFGIIFLALFLLAGLIQSLVFFQMGTQMYSLQTFVEWFILLNIMNLSAAIIILFYFYYKSYWFAFYTSIFASVVALSHFIILYNILVSRALLAFLIPSSFLLLGAGMLYGASLILSSARERPWLKALGVLQLIQVLVLLSALTWSINSGDVQTNTTVEKINQWATLAASIMLVLYIMNFVGEMKHASSEKNPSLRKQSLYGVLGISGITALVAIFLIGTKINAESQNLINWNNRGPERAQQMAEPFEARTYVSDQGDTMRFRLLLPLEYNPQKKYPLVVCLHGGGGWGTDNIKQIEGSWMAQMLSSYANKEKYPSVLFVPQCPPGNCWGGIPELPFIDSLVFETIGALEKELAIDAKRRYVVGGSLGGYGSWYFISTRPEMFAAAVPICGGGDPCLAANLTDVPIWAFHGENDRSVPVRFSRDMIEAIKYAGGNPKYTEFPGEGHIISNQVMGTPGLLDWLFDQKRE